MLVYGCPAYYNDICVGSIACRLEKKDDGNVRLYIMTLGVLAPYRRLGIGKSSELCGTIFKQVTKMGRKSLLSPTSHLLLGYETLD